MRRLIAACAVSLGLYLVAHVGVLDRPLSHGALASAMEARLARAASLAGPRLILLAGSNAPYSHRCAELEPALGVACVNAGLAVGIGLDYLFARWERLLRPGDTVYLPMEPAQYVATRLATATGPDASIMARRDRATLALLAPERWLAAAFAMDARGGLMALVETALAGGGLRDPRAGQTNAWGDRVGHAAPHATPGAPALLAGLVVRHPAAVSIRDGHGAALIAGFTRRATARGVRVIGGLSTGFADTPLPEPALAAIAAVYLDNGGGFLALPNRSRYPRADFFDGPEHLTEPAQIAHSRALAVALRPLLHPPARIVARVTDPG